MQVYALFAVIPLAASAQAQAAEANAKGGNTTAAETGPAETTGMDSAVRLGPGVKVRRVVVIEGPDGSTLVERGTISGRTLACEDDPSAVYCNTLGQYVFGPSDSLYNARFADDITTTAAHGCSLDRYVIRVTGDKYQDGSGTGAYTVEVGLFDACPGAGGDAIPGTTKQIPIDAQYASDIMEIEISPMPIVELPTSFHMGVKFSRKKCGVVVGAPATLGFSTDRFDFPSFACAAGLGGFPNDPHASFYAEIYVQGECPSTFPGYKNSNHAGDQYSAGVGVRFADDITLGVSECTMVAWEFAHKGNGGVGLDLRSHLDNADPVSGGLIPGTRSACFSSGNDVQICRYEPWFCSGGDRDGYMCDPEQPVEQECPEGSCIHEPILLPQDLWAVYRAGSDVVGPLLTCKHADPGYTANLFQVYTDGQWAPTKTPSQCWAAFELTIFCEGTPPLGACCDMYLKDEENEAICRDSVAEMNCATPEWVEGRSCLSECEGGEHDGEPCTRQADCPEGTCPGPFAHPCGQSACCKPDDTCENLTMNECRAVPPVDDPRMYQQGNFCGEGGQQCPPFMTCLSRVVGDCSIARPEVGCENPFCCTDVCQFDPWCCEVAWDGICVRWSREFCNEVPFNYSCFDSEPGYGALPIEMNSTTVINLDHTSSVGDPGFCCSTPTPGERGAGTVWFKFVAPPNGECDGGDRDGLFCDPNAEDPDNTIDGCPAGVCLSLPSSVELDTCCSVPFEDSPADDSLIQVFAVDDLDRGLCADGITSCSVSAQDCADGSTCVFDEQTACQNLMPIACSDDNEDCDCYGYVNSPKLSKVCVTDLIPGDTYYVMMGPKDEVDDWVQLHLGVYTLRISSPCSLAIPPLPNDLCMNSELLAGDYLEIPFDISGGVDYSTATFDCPGPSDTLLPPDSMQNDIWYDWVATCNGTVTVHTCGEDDASTPDTTMCVYDGCDCPVDNESALGCDDSQP